MNRACNVANILMIAILPLSVYLLNGFSHAIRIIAKKTVKATKAVIGRHILPTPSLCITGRQCTQNCTRSRSRFLHIRHKFHTPYLHVMTIVSTIL